MITKWKHDPMQYRSTRPGEVRYQDQVIHTDAVKVKHVEGQGWFVTDSLGQVYGMNDKYGPVTLMERRATASDPWVQVWPAPNVEETLTRALEAENERDSARAKVDQMAAVLADVRRERDAALANVEAELAEMTLRNRKTEAGLAVLTEQRDQYRHLLLAKEETAAVTPDEADQTWQRAADREARLRIVEAATRFGVFAGWEPERIWMFVQHGDTTRPAMSNADVLKAYDR